MIRLDYIVRNLTLRTVMTYGRKEASRRLGISDRGLRYKLQKIGMEPRVRPERPAYPVGFMMYLASGTRDVPVSTILADDDYVRTIWKQWLGFDRAQQQYWNMTATAFIEIMGKPIFVQAE